MMALEPHVFMFDEPTAGMSVDDVPVILDLIKTLKAEGDKTILLVEHKMDVVRSLADRIVVLHNGRLVADGEPAEVIGSAIVQEAYLGHSGRERQPCLSRCSRWRACTPTSASTTSCRASTSPCRRGAMTVLLGRNGAGKTTTLRTIMGLWKPSRGQVTFAGQRRSAAGPRPTSRAPASPTCRRRWRCSRTSRCARTWSSPPATVRCEAARLDWMFAFFPALKRFWTHPAGVLSGGQKQMLSIARAIIEPRRLILIDEPTKGIAPAIIDNMIRAFRELKRERHHHPAGGAEFPLRRGAGRLGGGDGRRPHRASRQHGRACRAIRRRRRACSACRWRRTDDGRFASRCWQSRPPACRRDGGKRRWHGDRRPAHRKLRTPLPRRQRPPAVATSTPTATEPIQRRARRLPAAAAGAGACRRRACPLIGRLPPPGSRSPSPHSPWA